MRKTTRLANAVCFGLLVAAFAAPAHATSITVMFNGIDGFGMAESAAFDARDNFGFEIISLSDATSAVGILEIALQNLDESSIAPFPPTGPGPHTASSSWAMQNVSGGNLMVLNAIIFATVLPFEVGGQMIEYANETVGLTIDDDDGWIIVHLTDGLGQNFYYPTLLLGELEADEISEVFEVNYYVDGEIRQVGVNYILPQLAYGYGVVPEPGTFALLGLGLTGLGLRRQRRA